MSNTLPKMEAHLAHLVEEKEKLEIEIEQFKRNASANKEKGNNASAKRKITLYLMKRKRVKQLTSMIDTANLMILAILNEQSNKVSSILSKSLMNMTRENEAALQRQMNALTRNAAYTSSAEHASYLKNMERGLHNAAAAPAEERGGVNTGPQPTPGSPAYYNRLLRTMPYFPQHTATEMARPSGPGIPLYGSSPFVVGGTSRHTRTGRKASRRRLTRRKR